MTIQVIYFFCCCLLIFVVKLNAQYSKKFVATLYQRQAAVGIVKEEEEKLQSSKMEYWVLLEIKENYLTKIMQANINMQQFTLSILDSSISSNISLILPNGDKKSTKKNYYLFLFKAIENANNSVIKENNTLLLTVKMKALRIKFSNIITLPAPIRV